MGNHLSGAALALIVISIMVSLSFPYTLYNGALYCNTTCADCVSALNNDSYSTVYLNSTLSSPGATCINNPANFSNKTFDCQGYSITGDKTSSTYGIYLNSRTNATIRNCTIEAFYQNARFYHTFNSTVTSLISFNSSTECAFLYNFTNGTFSNNTLHNCSNEGLDMYYSVNSTIANNTIYETVQQCIELRDSDYSTIEYNLLHGCNGGVDLHGGGGIDEYVTIRNNTIYNSSSGIQIWRGVNNVIVNNTIHGPYNQIEYYRYVPISLYVLNGPEYCDNTVQDNIGPGGLPIYYSNETVNWDGITAAQILLCDSDNSVVTNSIVNASGDPDYAPFEANFMFRYCDNLTVSSSIADMGSFEFYDATNTTVLDNTAHGAFSSGFSAFSSNGTYFYNNTAYDNNYTGFLIRSNNSTLEGNTAYNNGYTGIMVHIFNDFSLWTVGPNSTGANLTSNTVYGNKLGGIFISDSQNATISGNNVYSNGYGFVDYPLYWYYAVAEDRYFGIYIGLAYNVSLSGNTIHSNNYYGIAINNSDNITSSGDTVYENGLAEIIASTPSASNISFASLTLHPYGYPTISFPDELEANTAYTIKQVSPPTTTRPDSLSVVESRMINITNITGSPTITSMEWSWGAQQEGSYDESTFDLWKYITSWTELNATTNTTANTLNYSSISMGAYGILGVALAEDEGNDVEEAEPECESDSDCAGCETCTAGECTPYGECFIDSDCAAEMGEGYACDSCYCTATAPECTSDTDCEEGEICSQYSCVASPESGCVSDSECPTGYSCENNECIQTSGEGQIPGGECSSDNDCPPAQHCDGGTCSGVYCPCGSVDNHVCTGYECCSGTDCPQGYSCTNNECVEGAPEPGEGGGRENGEGGGTGEEAPGGGEVEIPGEGGTGTPGAGEKDGGSIFGFLEEVLFDTTYEPGGVEDGEPVMVAHKSIKEAWIWLIILLLAAAVYVSWRRRR